MGGGGGGGGWEGVRQVALFKSLSTGAQLGPSLTSAFRNVVSAHFTAERAEILR